MDRVTQLGLSIFFRLATLCPGIVRWLKPALVRIAYAASPAVRRNTEANARVILDPSISHEAAKSFGLGVLGYFLDFVLDVSLCRCASPESLAGRVSAIDGHERYMTTRASKRGAILLTAHMGSFELGMAALRKYESRIHVVFKRDAMGPFERLRSGLRRRFDVLEAPIDDGWTIWMRLRESLMNDDVVLIQGDRVMPGQRGLAVPFLHGQVMLPTGPVKLAAASGSPIVPVFCVRDADGRVRLVIEECIDVPGELTDEAMQTAITKIAKVLERYVRDYPEQWLVLAAAFDQEPPTK